MTDTKLPHARARVQAEIDALALPRRFPFRPALATVADVPDILALAGRWSTGRGNLCGWDAVSGSRLTTLLDDWLAITVRDRKGTLALFAANHVVRPPLYELKALVHTSFLALATQGIPVCRALLRLGYTHLSVPSLAPSVHWVADALQPVLPLAQQEGGRNVKTGERTRVVEMPIEPALKVLEEALAQWRP